MKVGHLTLGCKANAYDTESILSMFEQRGYEIVREHEFADIFVINTCSVTNIAQRKSRQAIERVLKLNPNAIIVATGCYAQIKPDEVEALKNVAVVCGTRDRHKIVDLTELYTSEHKKGRAVTDSTHNCEFEDIDIEEFKGKARVQLKIQDGCNNFCSYCIIPYARGRSCSKPVERVLEQAKKIADQGFNEVVLTGIEITSYGNDLENCTFTDILEKIHEVTRGTNLRIRLGSLDPRVVTEDFVKRISKLERLCPQFHLSLQSGSDTVLKRMNRKYDTKAYYEGVLLLRKHFNAPAITTDIIVGFPGETEEEFAETVEFAKKVGFAKIHVFPYSVREGTLAAKMNDQIPHALAAQRAKKLSETEQSMRYEYINSYVGKKTAVLFEEQKLFDGKLYSCGYTPEYIYVKTESNGIADGTIKNVIIKERCDDFAIGELCD